MVVHLASGAKVRKHTKKLRDEGSEILIQSVFPEVEIEVDRRGTIKLDMFTKGFDTRMKLPEPGSTPRRTLRTQRSQEPASTVTHYSIGSYGAPVYKSDRRSQLEEDHLSERSSSLFNEPINILVNEPNEQSISEDTPGGALGSVSDGGGGTSAGP